MKTRKTTQTVWVETHPDVHVVSFHTRAELSKSMSQRFNRPLRVSSEHYLTEVGMVGEKIVRQILELNGTTAVTIEPYRITVNKAVLYEWKELKGKIIAIIKENIPKEPKEEPVAVADDKSSATETPSGQSNS